MRIFVVLSFLFWACNLLAQDTFSIVAVDPETGEVGSAGASCIDDADCGGCGGVIIISGLIPGKGAMNSQAWACFPNVNLNNGLTTVMTQGHSPDSVLNYVLANDACWAANMDNSYRQYGIVDLDVNGIPRAAAYTGENADDYKNHIIGPNYAIQGNILLGQEILDNMETALLNTEGTLAIRLMAALQGANIPGADARCLQEGVSSKSAFIRVARPGDSVVNYYLELNVPETPFGVEPIDALQALFDEWLITNTSNLPSIKVEIAPNPSKEMVQFSFESIDNIRGGQITFYDIGSKQLAQKTIDNTDVVITKNELGNPHFVFYAIKTKEAQSVKTGKLLFH